MYTFVVFGGVLNELRATEAEKSLKSGKRKNVTWSTSEADISKTKPNFQKLGIIPISYLGSN